MKNLFYVKLRCPFCNDEISYNILSFKAKHECEHCENDLIVRAKPLVSTIISIVGFVLIFGMMDVLGITQMSVIIRFLFILGSCLLYLAIAYLLYCKLFGAGKLYAVDAMDPVMLKRYKKK